MEDKVKITNLVSSKVTIDVPDLRLIRTWEKKKAVKTIPFETLQEAIYEPGVEFLFTQGILGIDDMDVKKALGLEPDDATEPVNIITLNDAQRKRYLTVMPFAEFKQEIQKLPLEQVKELAQYAIENEITSFDKAEIIKKLVNVDIIKSIELNRQDKPEEAEGEK